MMSDSLSVSPTDMRHGRCEIRDQAEAVPSHPKSFFGALSIGIFYRDLTCCASTEFGLRHAKNNRRPGVVTPDRRSPRKIRYLSLDGLEYLDHAAVAGKGVDVMRGGIDVARMGVADARRHERNRRHGLHVEDIEAFAIAAAPGIDQT